MLGCSSRSVLFVPFGWAFRMTLRSCVCMIGVFFILTDCHRLVGLRSYICDLLHILTSVCVRVVLGWD